MKELEDEIDRCKKEGNFKQIEKLQNLKLKMSCTDAFGLDKTVDYKEAMIDREKVDMGLL